MAGGAGSCNNMADPLGAIKFGNRENGKLFPGKGKCFGQKIHVTSTQSSNRDKPNYLWCLYLIHGKLHSNPLL